MECALMSGECARSARKCSAAAPASPNASSTLPAAARSFKTDQCVSASTPAHSFSSSCTLAWAALRSDSACRARSVVWCSCVRSVLTSSDSDTPCFSSRATRCSASPSARSAACARALLCLSDSRSPSTSSAVRVAILSSLCVLLKSRSNTARSASSACTLRCAESSADCALSARAFDAESASSRRFTSAADVVASSDWYLRFTSRSWYALRLSASAFSATSRAPWIWSIFLCAADSSCCSALACSDDCASESCSSLTSSAVRIDILT
mmetsp:Transcript_5861/g.14857  ORF Transcript_5861/g.14857 Transcript_5861/m.14857 type:complete len:268 (-) Transcript_5861:1507-2310(-)